MVLTVRRAAPTLLLAVLACTVAAPPPQSLQAQAPPQRAPEPTDPEIRQTVARISLVGGEVLLARGDDPDDWQAADINVPMTLGDRVWTGDDGRLELQLHGGNLVRLASRTDLAALNLTGDAKQLSLNLGTASFKIRRLGNDEVFEVDTPNAAITLERPGEYRVDVDGNGNTRVQVRGGRAIAAAGGGQAPLSAGEEMDIDGVEAPRYDIVALPRPDGWDRWVEDRDEVLARAVSYTYVASDVAGAEDLDRYGRWQQIPEYGWAWSPLSVEAGWAPYRAGRWMWQDPWGWTWVSAEPWGWAPYHYGRWAFWGSSWYWVPVGPSVRLVAYSPALVAFVGGGTVGYVGWFPLAPRDPFIPWWTRGPAVNVTRITYVNRTYVTVVNQTTFVSGRLLTRDYVRDRGVIRSIESAPVLHGPIPVVPTRQSIRVATRETSVARPPAAAASRPVVTRMVPPPPPPHFDAKVAVIRDNRGAPVNPAEATRLSAQDRTRPVERVRPPAAEPGRAKLAPKSDETRGTAPGAPARGREIGGAPISPAPSVERSQEVGRPPEGARPTLSPERARPTGPPERARPTPSPEPPRETTAQRPPSEPAQAAPPGGEATQPARRTSPEPRAERPQDRSGATPPVTAAPPRGRPEESGAQKKPDKKETTKNPDKKAKKPEVTPDKKPD